jgi:hypothetical protein
MDAATGSCVVYGNAHPQPTILNHFGESRIGVLWWRVTDAGAKMEIPVIILCDPIKDHAIAVRARAGCDSGSSSANFRGSLGGRPADRSAGSAARRLLRQWQRHKPISDGPTVEARLPFGLGVEVDAI